LYAICPRTVDELTRTVALPERLRDGLSKRCSYTCTRLVFSLLHDEIFASMSSAPGVMEGWLELRLVRGKVR
jgi:hypothetical protein